MSSPSVRYRLNQMINNMKLLYSLLLILLLASCGADFVVGGETTETRQLGDFSRIDVDVITDVIVEEGPSAEVVVVTDANFQEEVITTVEDGILTIRLASSVPEGVDVSVIARTSVLSVIKKDGIGDLSISGISNVGSLTIDQDGIGDLTVACQYSTMLISKSGIGAYDGYGSNVEAIDIRQAGTGDCRVRCSDMLIGTMSSTGDLLYRGTPFVDIKVNGTGQLINDN